MELGKISKDNLSKVKLNGFKTEKMGTLNVNSLGTVELIHGSLTMSWNSNFISMIFYLILLRFLKIKKIIVFIKRDKIINSLME